MKFPSKNKDSLYTEIRSDFRLNKDLTSGEALDRRFSEALEGLKQLNSYKFNDQKR